MCVCVWACSVCEAYWSHSQSLVLVQDYDKPEYIPDPDAKKPEDWDDDMDGEWEPPMIPNPDYKVHHIPRSF